MAAAGSVLMAVAAWMASEDTLLAGMLVVFVGCGTVCANFQTTGLRCLALNQHSLGVTIMTMAVQIAASIGPFVSVGTMSGIQGAVGEAQSALGYEGAWLLAALVCAMARFSPAGPVDSCGNGGATMLMRGKANVGVRRKPA